jgi:hypothetical protein
MSTLTAPKLNPSELRDLIRQDYAAFFSVMYPRLKLGRFQKEILMPVISRFEKGEWQKLMVLMPPNHGKTTAITVPLPQFRLGNQPDKTVMLLSYSNDLAKDFGQRIKTGILGLNFKSIFPSFGLQAGAKAKNFFRTNEGGTFYAIGLNGTVEGKRADLLVIDDPISDIQEARSATRMETLMATYDHTVKNRLNPDAQTLMVTTRWCLGDFVDRVRENEGELWKVLTLPAEPEPDDKPGEYLWPEHFKPEYYEERKINQEVWNAKFQQAPQRGQGPWFKSREWILWYKDPVKRGKYNTYMLVDPALKRNSSSDRTSIMVIMAAPPIAPSTDPAFILVDWTLDRMDPGERHIEIIRLARKWGVIKIGFEEYGLMSDSYHLENALRQASVSVPVIPLGRSGPTHRLSKEDRINNLVPLFRGGQIVMPRSMVRRLKSGEIMDLMRYFLEHEYDKYAGKGTTRFDDALDCLARVMEPEMYFSHDIPGKKNEAEWSPQPSWVCNY